jgi:hypothetical protein
VIQHRGYFPNTLTIIAGVIAAWTVIAIVIVFAPALSALKAQISPDAPARVRNTQQQNLTFQGISILERATFEIKVREGLAATGVYGPGDIEATLGALRSLAGNSARITAQALRNELEGRGFPPDRAQKIVGEFQISAAR